MKRRLLALFFVAIASLCACSDRGLLNAVDGKGLGENADSNLLRINVGAELLVRARVSHPEVEGSTVVDADDVRSYDPSVVRVDRRAEGFVLVGIREGEAVLGLYVDGSERARAPIKVGLVAFLADGESAHPGTSPAR